MVNPSPNPKWFLKSKTIIGVLAAAIPTLLPVLGVGSDPQDGVLIQSVADRVIELGGLGIAVWGRFSASSPVTILPTKKKPVF